MNTLWYLCHTVTMYVFVSLSIYTCRYMSICQINDTFKNAINHVFMCMVTIITMASYLTNLVQKILLCIESVTTAGVVKRIVSFDLIYQCTFIELI